MQMRSQELFMQLHEIQLPKEAFLAIDTRERAFFLAMGRVSNEVMWLKKLFLIGVPNAADGIHIQRYQFTQALFIARLIVGKLFEARVLIATYYHGNPELSRDYARVIGTNAVPKTQNIHA